MANCQPITQYNESLFYQNIPLDTLLTEINALNYLGRGQNSTVFSASRPRCAGQRLVLRTSKSPVTPDQIEIMKQEVNVQIQMSVLDIMPKIYLFGTYLADVNSFIPEYSTDNTMLTFTSILGQQRKYGPVPHKLFFFTIMDLGEGFTQNYFANEAEFTKRMSKAFQKINLLGMNGYCNLDMKPDNLVIINNDVYLIDVESKYFINTGDASLNAWIMLYIFLHMVMKHAVEDSRYVASDNIKNMLRTEIQRLLQGENAKYVDAFQRVYNENSQARQRIRERFEKYNIPVPSVAGIGGRKRRTKRGKKKTQYKRRRHLRRNTRSSQVK